MADEKTKTEGAPAPAKAEKAPKGGGAAAPLVGAFAGSVGPEAPLLRKSAVKLGSTAAGSAL